MPAIAECRGMGLEQDPPARFTTLIMQCVKDLSNKELRIYGKLAWLSLQSWKH